MEYIYNYLSLFSISDILYICLNKLQPSYWISQEMDKIFWN